MLLLELLSCRGNKIKSKTNKQTNSSRKKYLHYLCSESRRTSNITLSKHSLSDPAHALGAHALGREVRSHMDHLRQGKRKTNSELKLCPKSAQASEGLTHLWPAAGCRPVGKTTVTTQFNLLQPSLSKIWNTGIKPAHSMLGKVICSLKDIFCTCFCNMGKAVWQLFVTALLLEWRS